MERACFDDFCTKLDIIGAIEMSRVPFYDMDYDGIFGLGMKGLSIKQSYSFLEQIKQESLFDIFFIDKLAKNLVFEQSELTNGLKVPVITKFNGLWAIEI